MRLKEFVSVYFPFFEKELASRLYPGENLPYQDLFNAAHYALMGQAKRLRPLLVMTAAKDLGAPPEKTFLPAAAIEMVHTYSLIHDDLPCMDDDDMRRGKPSLHRAFTEGLAVLTGDFFLTEAFYLLTKDHTLSEKQRLSLIEALAKYAGGKGMIGGQVMDIKNQEKPEFAFLEETHKLKTAGLMAVSLYFGGVIANCPQDMLDVLKQLGEKIGLAYQTYDDIQDAGETGNTSSLYENLGEKGAKARLSNLLKEIRDAFGNSPSKLPLVEELVSEMFPAKAIPSPSFSCT